MNWIKVTPDELETVWKALRTRNEIYNGCTDVELRRIYGNDNVKHVMGDGWYKRRWRLL